MINGLKTPDVTLAQLLAALAWTTSQAVATTVLSPSSAQLLMQIGSTVIAAAWTIGDAVIRHGRATGGTGSGGTT